MNILKRGMVFITFFGCCFAIALMAAAMSTKFWLEAEAIQRRINPDNRIEVRPNSTGHVNFGLFKGRKSLNVGFGTRLHPFDVDHAEFMDYGLWVGTVACLGLGMVFAVVGALFAVINTATTPVEAITGVPGLYLWNALAALFNLICVILWAVQFHKHLTNNVLLYDAADGWTTAGQESFGYSYWLVVVAIFVHVVNIGIIYMGTYDPKVKEQLQAPDPKGGNIMLY
ncbi:clarin-3-like [Homarus americanus]|uniref:clarin-3-like n=1 Tax=Homarus americanus TaxID=6706 RepID=UPI001C43A81E|nr:clarin-3-like [Homarus americanus]